MNNYLIVDHPLLKDKLTILRNKKTEQEEVRRLVNEMTSLLAFEATKNITLTNVIVETPLTSYQGFKLNEDIVIAPILRAGLSMVDSMLNLLPNSKVAHIGLYRDENKEAKQYYLSLPNDLSNSLVIIVDPMLATGSSLIKTIDILKEHHAKSIVYIGILGTKEGINNVLNKHQDVKLFLADLDPKLNEKGYIVPGLGDAGDRLYGTLK